MNQLTKIIQEQVSFLIDRRNSPKQLYQQHQLLLNIIADQHSSSSDIMSQPLPTTPTLLQQTLQEIQSRVIFFSQHNISAQNSLLPTQSLTLRSISQIIPPLKYFDICDTPLNANLSSIYANEQNINNLKWSIPPASEGEDSINEQQIFQPSFKWLTSTLIDPSLLIVDQPQPVRIQKGKIPQQWISVNSLLIHNVSQKIYLKEEILAIQKSIKRKFSERYSWLKFKRLKQVYYKGKPSLILKFADSNSASFVYYSYATFKSNRSQFGEACEVFRIKADNTKQYQKQKNWLLLFFRHLPLSFTKQQLLNIFKQHPQVDIKWVEQLIEIAGAKYTIAKVNYLDDALALCSVFNTKKIRDAKVNLHPKSSKNWRAEEEVMQLQHNEEIMTELNGNIILNETLQKSY